MGYILLKILKNKFFISFLVLLFASFVTAGVYTYELTRNLPDIGDVKGVIKNQTTFIYAADGTLITKLYQDNREIVPLKDVSPTLQHAVVSIEDQRFYEHRGIDYVRIIGAMVRNIKSGGASQGGSTITQQYVKNAYFSPEKTFSRKIKEAFLAIRLERNYTKDQIMEKYLNTIYFGNRTYGIEVASQFYFGVPASKLNVEQSALLAGLIRGPESYNPYRNPDGALKRRNLVIDLMKDQGYIKEDEARIAKSHPLGIITKHQPNYTGIAAFFAEWVKTELKGLDYSDQAIYSQGFRIYTTLDTKMQEDAELAWKKYLPSPNDPEVALVSIDPKTGAVKAMVGGKDFNANKYNIAAQGGRQPGSSFKPYTLAAALMNGISIDDGFDGTSPMTVKVPGNKPWIVHNAEGGMGNMDLRRATALSVNVVFAQLIAKVGVDKVIEVARALGITSELNPNPAITLGGITHGLTPLEMASAYSTFANNGVYNKPYGVQKIVMPNNDVIYEHKDEPKVALDPAVNYLVTDALKGVLDYGTGTRARIGRPAAGKTGTTTDFVDAWFCGYTPDLATAVWVGYRNDAEKKYMTNVHGIRVFGGTFPAQIWSTFMKRALAGVKPSGFPDAPRGSFTTVSL